MRKLMNMLDEHRTASNVFVIVVAITFYMLLSHIPAIRAALSDLFYYISPFLTGIILAYIFHPIYTGLNKYVFGRLKNRSAAHGLSVFFTVLLAIAIIGLLLWAIIPEVISSVKLLVADMDDYFESVKGKLDDLNSKIPYIDIDVDKIVGSWQKYIKKAADWVLNNITSILSTSYKVGQGVVDALIAFVMSIYVLAAQKNLFRAGKRFCYAIFKEETYNGIADFAKRSNTILKGYIGGNILDAVIIGVANLIFMAICGMPSAGLISIIVGVTNIIPTFGPFIGAIPSALILLILDPKSVLWFVIFTIILQQIDGNIIKPLLFGDSAGLAPIWVLVSIIVFGRMFGLVGMLLGVPLFAILRLLYEYFIEKRFEKKGVEDPYHPDSMEKRPSFVSRVAARIRESKFVKGMLKRE
ncbi:MAG: AI-2E family transporter [Clostridia bacterium]|nr:AI-2E family transporter [Clostridia bacterium]